MAVCVKEHPRVVDLLPVVDHLAALRIHVVAVGAVGEPAGLHLAVLTEVVVDAVNLLPAGLHFAVRAHPEPVVADLHPLERAAPVCLEVVPAVVHVAPAHRKFTGAAHKEVVVADLEPVLLHQNTVLEAVVPLALVLNPTGLHEAVAAEVVPLAVNLLEALEHNAARRIHIVVTVLGLNPALVAIAAVVVIHPVAVFGSPAARGKAVHCRGERKRRKERCGSEIFAFHEKSSFSLTLNRIFSIVTFI